MQVLLVMFLSTIVNVVLGEKIWIEALALFAKSIPAA